MSVQTSDGVLFGDFRLDRNSGGLFRLDAHGRPVPLPLGSRALDALCVLVERQGDLVSKQTMMDAVWPDTVVEENNLSVQISALRRVLDQGRAEGSCIQTIPGRGYRLVVPVRYHEEAARSHAPPTDNGAKYDAATATERSGTSVVRLPWWRDRARVAVLAVAFCAAVIALLTYGRGHYDWLAGRPGPPRLSLVVLPFENLSGDPGDEYLAEGITDDLTSDLSRMTDTVVIARESAYAYKSKPEDVRKIGKALGVRYVLEGSVRRMGTTLRVNVQLTSAENGAHLWSERFDEDIGELAAGQEQIVARMRESLGWSIIEIENARSLRERPTNPDAFDLILRARSLQHLPPTRQRNQQASALYQRAVMLDPSSVPAMVGAAYFLIENAPTGGWGNFEDMQRAANLLARARAIAPDSALVLNTTVYWLRSVGRCQEVLEAAQLAIQTDPSRMNTMTGVYNELGRCKTATGHAEEEIALQDKANRLNPHSPWMFVRYLRMGFASLMLGRNQDAITYLQRSLALNPDNDSTQGWTDRLLAAAYARTGQMEDAKRSLAEADRLWPYDTVRGHWPEDSTSAVYAEQIKGYQASLRLAGERDHADEDADLGVPADRALHSEFAGPTPTAAPGVRTIRTADLARMLAETRPVVIDAVTYSWGRSIPGAVGLRFAGLGGRFTDAAQDRLRGRLRDLTDGDLNRPIVAVGWNSERFDGRNLALRLAALGYTQVYWYRGGREAWEVNRQPETDLNIEDW